MSFHYYSGPRPTRWPLRPVTVYTFFDADDQALYVGCTGQQYVRFAGHGRKDWWTDVVRVEVEHFEDKSDGLRRERKLIRKLRPKHNIAAHPERDALILKHRRESASFDALFTDHDIGPVAA